MWYPYRETSDVPVVPRTVPSIPVAFPHPLPCQCHAWAAPPLLTAAIALQLDTLDHLGTAMADKVAADMQAIIIKEPAYARFLRAQAHLTKDQRDTLARHLGKPQDKK